MRLRLGNLWNWYDDSPRGCYRTVDGNKIQKRGALDFSEAPLNGVSLGRSPGDNRVRLLGRRWWSRRAWHWPDSS